MFFYLLFPPKYVKQKTLFFDIFYEFRDFLPKYMPPENILWDFWLTHLYIFWSKLGKLGFEWDVLWILKISKINIQKYIVYAEENFKNEEKMKKLLKIQKSQKESYDSISKKRQNVTLAKILPPSPSSSAYFFFGFQFCFLKKSITSRIFWHYIIFIFTQNWISYFYNIIQQNVESWNLEILNFNIYWRILKHFNKPLLPRDFTFCRFLHYNYNI